MNNCKIDLEINSCKECPYSMNTYSIDHGEEFHCRHKCKKAQKVITDGDFESVPDWCPFFMDQLKSVLEKRHEITIYTIPKKYIQDIERRHKALPDPKYSTNHGYEHIENVIKIGDNYLDQLVKNGFIKEDNIAKLKIMLKITAMLHDIGLSETVKNHAARSVSLAQNWLDKTDLAPDTKDEIIHAIMHHSDGADIRNFLDQALLIGDKLDITKDRVIQICDAISREQSKINSTSFIIDKGKAVLRWNTEDDFDSEIIFKNLSKLVEIPAKIAKENLGLSFEFYLNDKLMEPCDYCLV